jgi:hypothetical protein
MLSVLPPSSSVLPVMTKNPFLGTNCGSKPLIRIQNGHSILKKKIHQQLSLAYVHVKSSAAEDSVALAACASSGAAPG